jgi:hypothetical protein
MLCGPTSTNQRGSFSTSTYHRRKQLKPRGFKVRGQEGVVSNNLVSVSAVNIRNVRSHSSEGEVIRGVTLREEGRRDLRNEGAPIRWLGRTRMLPRC